MNEAEYRKQLQQGLDKVKPKIQNMASEMMSCYYQGFHDCWKFLTGEDLDLDN